VHEWGLVDVPLSGPAEIGAGPGQPDGSVMSVRKPVIYVHADPGSAPITLDVVARFPSGELVEHWPTTSEWQERKAFGVNVAWSQYRIRGNSFWFLPAPTAGESVYYEYVSSYFCESAAGTAQAAWTADTDVPRIPENVMTLGLIWRWKAAKGMEHSGDYNSWVEAKERAAARSGSKRKLSAVGPSVPPRGGRGTIPEGNWP
jgi:hypothetical protein